VSPNTPGSSHRRLGVTKKKGKGVHGRDGVLGIVPSSLRGIWMSVISPKGMNALCRRSRVVSDGSDETWIVHFARAVAVAAIFYPLQ
jgi:hypothetical protein